jgi:hypothetical protein
MVSQSTAFRGCFQLVFELVRPAEVQDLAADEAAAHLQALQQQVEQRLRAWLPPGWGVRAVQVGPLALAAAAAGVGAGAGGAPPSLVQPALPAAAGGGARALAAAAAAPGAAPAKADSLADFLVSLWSQSPVMASGILLRHMALPSSQLDAPAAASPTALSGATIPSIPSQASVTCSGDGGHDSSSLATAAPGGGGPGRRTSSSSGVSIAEDAGASGGSVSATLLVARAVVAQLLQQGYRQLSAVVVAQPQAVSLLHASWELPPADGAGAGDLELPLVFSRADALRHAQGLGRDGSIKVLSVVVLAGSTTQQQQQPMAAAASAVQQQQQQPLDARALDEPAPMEADVGADADDADDADAAGAADGGAAGGGRPQGRAPGILAHLPLLLLPGAAQLELVRLLHAALAAGMTEQQALSQVLLPLIQDWVLVLLWGDSTSSAAHQQPLQRMRHALFESLSAHFTKERTSECLRLLAGRDADEQAAAAGAASASAAPASSGTEGAAASGSSSSAGRAAAAAAAGSGNASPLVGGDGAAGGMMRCPADFYLYCFKITPCPALYNHGW